MCPPRLVQAGCDGWVLLDTLDLIKGHWDTTSSPDDLRRISRPDRRAPPPSGSRCRCRCPRRSDGSVGESLARVERAAVLDLVLVASRGAPLGIVGEAPEGRDVSGKQSLERGHTNRATSAAVATSPDQAPRRGLATSGPSASALGRVASISPSTVGAHPFSARGVAARAGEKLLRN